MKEHETEVSLREPIPTEADVGSTLSLRVRVSCPSGCDLRGARVTVMSGEDPVMAAELTRFEGGLNETEEIAVDVPPEIGEHAYEIVFPGQAGEGAAHERGSLALTVTARAHGTSLAAWDLPHSVVIGSRFELKVGARCSAGCDLAGREVVVSDEDGASVARARLGAVPWPGTEALYWADAELAAPAREGPAAWSLAFEPVGLALPHGDANARFRIAVVRPPEHTVTVTLRDRNTGEPLDDARVLVGPQRAVTDRSGVATLQVPAGTWSVVARKLDYDEPTVVVEVTADLAIDLEAERLPEGDEFAEWM